MKKFLEKLKPHLLTIGLITGFWLIVIATEFFMATYNSAYFKEIYKPPFYPPQFVFPLVWSLVYAILIVSVILALLKNKRKKFIIAITINGILNILWRLFFFTLRSKISGVIVLVFLIISTISLFKMLFRIKPLYFYINIPYLLWLFFLITLNYAILMIN